MSAHRIISAALPSLCQKLSKLVEIWRSSDKNNFAQFFSETRCIQLWMPRCIWTCTAWICAEIRDEVGTATRPWTILNMLVSLWFFRRSLRVGHCSFSSITENAAVIAWLVVDHQIHSVQNSLPRPCYHWSVHQSSATWITATLLSLKTLSENLVCRLWQ